MTESGRTGRSTSRPTPTDATTSPVRTSSASAAPLASARRKNCSSSAAPVRRAAQATRNVMSGAQIRLEEVHGALPGERRRRLVVAGSGVVVEPVLGARILEHLVLHVIGLERGLERRDARVDPFVVLGVLDEERRL